MVSGAKSSQELWLLDFRQSIHSQLSEKVQDKQANLYRYVFNKLSYFFYGTLFNVFFITHNNRKAMICITISIEQHINL